MSRPSGRSIGPRPGEVGHERPAHDATGEPRRRAPRRAARPRSRDRVTGSGRGRSQGSASTSAAASSATTRARTSVSLHAQRGPARAEEARRDRLAAAVRTRPAQAQAGPRSAPVEPDLERLRAASEEDVRAPRAAGPRPPGGRCDRRGGPRPVPFPSPRSGRCRSRGTWSGPSQTTARRLGPGGRARRSRPIRSIGPAASRPIGPSGPLDLGGQPGGRTERDRPPGAGRPRPRGRAGSRARAAAGAPGR